jgi:glycosyltransferase involved in cell wall biosynthesis
MKVLHLCSHDHGGAGTASVRLHEGMLAEGVDSRMAAMHRRSQVSGIIEIPCRFHPMRLYRLTCKAFLKLRSDADYYFHDQCMSLLPNPKTVCQLIDFKPDIVIAHNISHAVSPRDLLALHRETAAPLIMNLLDMGALTGGCHYAWECRGYEDKCGKCPALRSDHEIDFSRHIWQEKANAMAAMKVAAVAGSSWLLNQIRRSSLFRHKASERILLGVDPERFGGISRQDARKQLRLPQDVKIIFFGAQSFAQRRKGMYYLVESLNHLADQGIFDAGQVMAVSAGNHKPLVELVDSRVRFRHLGFLKGDYQLSLGYSAADVFVCPSIEDSGPMMINEAIMCGTPVVAFRMGVAQDLVITGQTGYLAPLRDSRELAYGIKQILSLDKSEAKFMSARCRAWAIDLCNPKKQASAFLAFCERVMSELPNED